MNRLLFTTIATAATLGAPAAARADFVLDTFANPSPGQEYLVARDNASPYTSSTTTVSAGVSRSIQVTVVSPNPPNFNSVSGIIGNGAFTMDSANDGAVTAQISYALSGSAGNLAGAGALELAFKNVNPGNDGTVGPPITIDIVTATGTLTTTTTIPGSTIPYSQSFAFGSFTGTGDLSQVNTIRITINGGASPQTAVDFAMDEIRVRTAVPAPPALVLAGIGLVGLLGRSRLRRPTA